MAQLCTDIDHANSNLCHLAHPDYWKTFCEYNPSNQSALPTRYDDCV